MAGFPLEKITLTEFAALFFHIQCPNPPIRYDELPFISTQKGQSVGEFEALLRTSAGEFPVLMSSRLISDERGRSWVYTALAPMGEMKRREQELQRSLRSRDDLLFIACHELKAPLAPLLLQAQWITRALKAEKMTPCISEKLFKIANQIEGQVGRLNRLVEDTLDSQLIKSGKLSIKVAKTDMVLLIERILDRFHYPIQQAQCTVRFQSDQSIEGEWDCDRLEQVLINLLSNAIKFGPGPTLEIELRKVDEGRIRLSIADQGPGIAPHEQARMFEMFERGESGRHVSGLGLGLYITREIVFAHGGKIWLESELGKGTKFFVELPTRNPAATAA